MSKFPEMLAIYVLALFSALLIQTDVALAQITGLGQPALAVEIAAWDIAVRPDGKGLPEGQGSVRQGEAIYLRECAQCHGDFGEGAGRFPVLAGGQGSLTSERPEKTIGSFWPYLSTVFDYIRRTMPFGNAQSLTADEVYALTAFLLNMNNLVADDFTLTRENFTRVRLPNENAFSADDRETVESQFWKTPPCMSNCKTTVTVLNRARSLNVTPETKTQPTVE